MVVGCSDLIVLGCVLKCFLGGCWLFVVVGCLDLIVLGCVLKWLYDGWCCCWRFRPDSFGLGVKVAFFVCVFLFLPLMAVWARQFWVVC